MSDSDAEGREVMRSVNPATAEVCNEFPCHSDQEVESILARASDAALRQRHRSFAERSRRLLRVAEILEERRQEFGTVITREMGKPICASIQEVEKCAGACRYFSSHAERFLQDEPADVEGAHAFVRYAPLGPVLAIMPWNFPFWQVFRFAAPTLMAGNVSLLKHASNVPECALLIESIFRDAGFDQGEFQTLLVSSRRVGRLIDDSRIRAVTLTGSVEAGRTVAAAAGRAIKKTVLELGGSDPFVVMPSANLDAAVSAAVQARIVNSGQSCIAAKRFIIDRTIADDFQHRMIERMASLKVGDPMLMETEVGPLATREIVDSLEQQVITSVELGARLGLGGRRLPGRGNYFAPTFLSDVPPEAPAAREELFGPVAVLWRCDGPYDAMRIANDSEFGLGASVWTNDEGERELFIDGLEAGMVFVNGMVASTASLPFGGVKNSGFGRELSCVGIREFVNIKAVSIATRSSGRNHTE